MTLTHAEAEAIRVFYGLSEQESIASTAAAFGVHSNTVRSIMAGKTHNGKPRSGNRRLGPRPRSFSVVGREKRQMILNFLRSGPKDINEIKELIGTDPGAYLTEYRKAGKIERKFVWVLK